MHEFYDHFLRYDKESLFLLLNKFKFSRVDFGYFFHLLYFPARLLCMSRTNRKVCLKGPAGVMEISLHELLARFFSLEERIVPKSYPGTSLDASIAL
ncbi:MAG: hypothetical protein CME25_08675 [Gemmatimonadetes bacterium]|nr:hypothetical protein [Gemmatimonadota bacterium]